MGSTERAREKEKQNRACVESNSKAILIVKPNLDVKLSSAHLILLIIWVKLTCNLI